MEHVDAASRFFQRQTTDERERDKSNARGPYLAHICVYPVKSCHSIELDECPVGRMGLEHDRRYVFVDDTDVFISQRKYPSLALVRPTLLSDNTLKLSAPNMHDFVVGKPTDVERRVRIFKDTLMTLDMGDDASAWITAYLGSPKPIRLVRIPANGPDANYSRPAHPKLPGVHMPCVNSSPVSVTNELSLATLNNMQREDAALPVPCTRFRSNLVIAGVENPWEEDTWMVVRIGEVTLYCNGPLFRCSMIGIDQETGVPNATDEPLATLQQAHTFPGKLGKGYFGVGAIPLTGGRFRVGDPVAVLERFAGGTGRAKRNL